MGRFIGAAPIAIAVALGGIPAAEAQVVGVSAAVKNDVRLKKPGTPLARPVQIKQRVALQDQVQTGVRSQLQVLLLDKSVFTVGANARLVIDRFVYDPNRNTRTLGATVSKGAFRFMSGKRATGGGSSINTPVATIGIRGTILEGVVGEAAALIAAQEAAVGARVQSDPDTASLIILRGPGGATQGNASPGVITVGAGGRSVTANQPLQAIYVPGPGMAPIGPFRISPNGLLQVQSLLNPSLAERFAWPEPADNLATVPLGVGAPLYPQPQQSRFPGRRLPPPGEGFGEDAPPGADLPDLPNPGLLQAPPPRPRAQPVQRAAPTPTPNQGPAPTASPTPTPNPNRSAPAPSPAPTPTPPSSLKSAPPPPPPSANQQPPPNQQPPNQSLNRPPGYQPTPAPTPTPTPASTGKKPQGQPPPPPPK